MADTVRTQSSLISIFATTGAGGITAQSSRDLIVSVMGCYAEIYITGNSTAQTGIGTSYTTLDWGNGGGDGAEDNTNADYANDRLEVGANGDGDYLILFGASVDGSASTVFTFVISVNGTPETGAICEIEFTAAAEIEHVSINHIAAGLSDGDLITVEVKADGASKQLTVREAQFVARRLG